MNKMTVILADDHTLVRKGIKAMLESDEDIEVVAEAGNGLEALEKAREFNPDLLIMDVRMPVMTGLDACGLLSGYAPRTKALILSMHDSEDYVRSEEHTSELQSLMRISYAVFCLKKKTQKKLLHCIEYYITH